MKEDIAIIGMSALFPGAPNIQTYWNNIINGVDAIREVPANRIPPQYFQTGGEEQYDRFYCSRGGFIDEYAQFDPYTFGILPLAIAGMEPEQLLTLQLAHQALTDAGVWRKHYALDKTAIIIGKGNYVGPGATRAVEIVHVAEQLLTVVRKLVPQLNESALDAIKKEFQLKKGRFTADTAMGLIPNLIASLVANRLNLGGAAYTVDAACASSLLALDHGVNELLSGRSDMVIAGGIHIGQNATFWSIFNQLGALSKKQVSRPFDEEADGLLIGEGGGFVVLKPLKQALNDGDRIYCVIKGIGVSSDGAGTSVMSPSVKGQLKAMSQAWTMAELEPTTIGYMEAHGTATPLGDHTELETLKQFFGTHPGGAKAKLGSVKSMIGHTMPAAGIAGVIKTALALYHDILPPTLHCTHPLAAMHDTCFEPISTATSWSATGLPRLAGVNAFGFGGINAHVILKAYEHAPTSSTLNNTQINLEDQVLLLSKNSHDALIEALEKQQFHTADSGDYRLAIFHPTEARLQKALSIVKKNKPWYGRQDIWYTNAPLLKGNKRLAFLFPGLDGLSVSETASIAQYFGIADEFGATAISEEKTVLRSALQQLQSSRTVDIALRQLGIKADIYAGHSLGEWLAGLSAGLVTPESIQRLLGQLDPSLFEVPDARFVAVGAGIKQMQPLLDTIPSLYLANDNCPQQIILCGSLAATEQLITELKKQQIFHQTLPFQSGFHTPFIQDRVSEIIAGMKAIDFLQPNAPIWSATTLAPYPDTIEGIRQLNVDHLINPVRFRALIEKLYHEEQVAMFIQVGSGSIAGFVDDTLKGHAYQVISATSPHRTGLAQLRRVLAALYVAGKSIDATFLGIEQDQLSNKQLMPLQLGTPIVADWNFPIREPITTETALNKEAIQHPLARAVAANMEETMSFYDELIQLLENTSPHNKQPEDFQKALNVSLTSHPYLIDHALVKQRKGWHCPDDMDPVIPMTMIIELLGELAQTAGQQPLRSLQNIQVFQWMNVCKPFQEIVQGSWMRADILKLTIPKYVAAEAVIGQHVSNPGITALDIGTPLPLTIDRDTIYDRHMFHGPAYQGIVSVTQIADRGIHGWIRGGSGKGSLLDNAGQLFGLWLQLTLPINKVAFPIKIGSIHFFEDFQDQSGDFECFCQLTDLNGETATADFLIKRQSKVWATVKGWQNIRLEFDERLWQVSMAPQQNLLAEEIAPGVFYFNKAYQKVISWDFIAKRYLPLADRKYLDQLPIHKRKAWLISRVAVRDAIRALLRREKNEAYFPIEFSLANKASGQPIIQNEFGYDVHISIAHKQEEAVGIARLHQSVGIDMEEIRTRSDGFMELVLTDHEKALIQHKPDIAEWLTRFWVAKEAFGKSIGKGLAGNPKSYEVATITDDELIIENTIVKTIKHKNYIIGWTL